MGDVVTSLWTSVAMPGVGHDVLRGDLTIAAGLFGLLGAVLIPRVGFLKQWLRW
jgi:hypothetical protein